MIVLIIFTCFFSAILTVFASPTVQGDHEMATSGSNWATLDDLPRRNIALFSGLPASIKSGTVSRNWNRGSQALPLIFSHFSINTAFDKIPQEDRNREVEDSITAMPESSFVLSCMAGEPVNQDIYEIIRTGGEIDAAELFGCTLSGGYIHQRNDQLSKRLFKWLTRVQCSQSEVESDTRCRFRFINMLSASLRVDNPTLSLLLFGETERLFRKNPVLLHEHLQRDPDWNIARLFTLNNAARSAKAILRKLPSGFDVASLSTPHRISHDTPLHRSFQQNQPEIALELLKAGAPIVTVTNSASDSVDAPIHQAFLFVEVDHDVVRELFALYVKRTGDGPTGINSAMSSVDGQHFETALHRVVRLGTVEIAKQLIEAGASLDIVDSYNKTPVAAAQELGRQDMMDMFNSALEQ